MYEMTEELKQEIFRDCLKAHTYQPDDLAKATRLIRLIRALDSYRERDSKGRFIKKLKEQPI